MITTQQMRIILDRNQNGLDGRTRVKSGERVTPGIYWNEITRRIHIVEGAGVADGDFVVLSNNLDLTIDELVRSLAMGGGGHSGRPTVYHEGAGAASQH